MVDAMASLSTGNDRVEVPRDAFLRTTRQLWKLTVASVILPWPAVATGWWVFRHLGPEQSTTELTIAIGFMAAVAALIAMLLASVQCPACGVRLFLQAIRDPAGLNAVTALLAARTCPSCRYDPRAVTTRV